MFPADLIQSAEALLSACRSREMRLATAESCTGGLIAAVLTEIPGSSDVVERGFVTYSNDAKIDMLGVTAAVIERHGAVSAAVALAMVEGALKHSRANLAVAVTGVAGPGGGTVQKPVGLVYLAVEQKGKPAVAQRFNFADMSRQDVRMSSVREALRLLSEAIAG
jgi:nicotinamide-nucleotide amidase